MRWLVYLRHKARPLARFGCVSIGTVYVVLGILALIALGGWLIEVADEDRMVPVLMELPGGPVLVWLIVAGTAGYVVWRIVEVLTDPYEFGRGAKGIAIRTGIALSAAAYGVVAVSVARIAVTHAGGAARPDAAEAEQQQLVARVFEWPGGEPLVGMAGAALFLVGIGQFVLLARRGYATEVHLQDRSRPMRTFIHVLAWYGYSARAVILAVLGYFLVRAAVRSNPADAGDTDTAFDFIGGGVVGDTAFFIVAVGTIAYGLFMYANACFYRFECDAGDAGADATGQQGGGSQRDRSLLPPGAASG